MQTISDSIALVAMMVALDVPISGGRYPAVAFIGGAC